MSYRDRPDDDTAGNFERLWRFLVQDYAERGGEFRGTAGRMADWKYNPGRVEDGGAVGGPRRVQAEGNVRILAGWRPATAGRSSRAR